MGEFIREWRTESEAETMALGRAFGRLLSGPCHIGLRGEMGMGKTVFVKGLAQGLGVESRIVSPTFQLVREHAGRLPLFHFDFYRIGSAGELAALDFYDYAARGVVAAEWGDKFVPSGVEDRIELSFEWVDENIRTIGVLESAGALAPLAEKNGEKGVSE